MTRIEFIERMKAQGIGVGVEAAVRALALLALPIAGFFVAAYLLWRAAQLRQVSEVLMQSAMRLIRPQDVATEGLTTIAQAVRSSRADCGGRGLRLGTRKPVELLPLVVDAR